MSRLLLGMGLILWLAVLAGGVYAIWFYAEQHSLSVGALEADVMLGSSTTQGISRLSVPKAKHAFGRGNAVFVDARSAHAYEAGHIPSALHVPSHTSTDSLRRMLASRPANIQIITYCSGGGCRSSYTLAKRLVKESIRDDVYVLTGGWPAWQQAGFPGRHGREDKSVKLTLTGDHLL